MSGYPSGRLLRAGRAMAGLSLDAMAEQSGIAKHRLHRIERLLDSGDVRAILDVLEAHGVCLTTSGVMMKVIGGGEWQNVAADLTAKPSASPPLAHPR